MADIDPVQDYQALKDCLNLQDRMIVALRQQVSDLQSKLDATLKDEALADMHALADKCRQVLAAEGRPEIPGPMPVPELDGDVVVSDDPATADDTMNGGVSLIDELEDPAK